MITHFPIEDEYKKNTGITPEDIAKLRTWLMTQPHLPGKLITELDLILTYHCCDRSAEVSKQVLDLNLTLRTHFDLFKSRALDDTVYRTLRTVAICMMTTRSPEGSAVIYGRLINTDSKFFIFKEVMRTVFTIMDCWQYKEGTWPGFVLVVDLAGLTLGHLTKLDVMTLQQFFYYLQATLSLLKSCEDFIVLENQKRVTEALRPGKPKSISDIFGGVEGSFKKLDID